MLNPSHVVPLVVALRRTPLPFVVQRVAASVASHCCRRPLDVEKIEGSSVGEDKQFQSVYVKKMGNVIESFASGIGNVVGKIFGSSLDFLSGKSCSSNCGPTWDLMCYIEHFCIGNLLKLALVFVLIYIAVLFIYLLYKLAECAYVGVTICRSIWACLSCWFHLWEWTCTCLCVKLCDLKRRRSRERFDRTGEHEYSDKSLRYYPRGSREANRSFSRRRRRNYKSSHLRSSLKPRNHRAQLRINADVSHKYEKRNHSAENLHDGNRNAIIRHGNHHSGTVHDLKGVRTFKFVNKGLKSKRRATQRRKKY